jgi:basic membrane protein A and related proteins
VRRPLHLIGLVLLVATALTVAACGSSSKDSSSSSSSNSSSASTATATPAGKKIKVGLVTDIGGLNDRSFNQLANQGLMQSEKDLGIQGRVLPSKSNSDYIPNLSTLAQQGYDLVIGVGFLMADAMDTVASKFPNTKFAIIDVDATTLKHKPTNVTGLLFKEQEAGYLAGYMAGLYMKDNGGSNPTIGSVGGQKIPPVDHYIAGYQAGAKAADPSIKTLNAYSQDFVDQAKCKEAALNQIQQGAKVVFQVAGQCGLGALDAAKEKSVQGIGVDADQSYLGAHILTSAEKKVDVAVETAIKTAQSGSIQGGTNVTFDLQNNGVGIGKTNAAGAKYQSQVDAVAAKIKSGEITDIPDTVK